MKSVTDLLQNRQAFCVAQDLSVLEVARLMAQRNIGAAPVLDGDRLAGIFSERDLLKRVIAAGRDPGQVRVGDVMTREVVVGEVSESLETILQRMKQAGCRHIPIVRSGQLIGVLSLRDLLLAEIEIKEKDLKVARTLVRHAGPKTVGIELVWKCLKCGQLEPAETAPGRCRNCGARREEFTLVEED